MLQFNSLRNVLSSKLVHFLLTNETIGRSFKCTGVAVNYDPGKLGLRSLDFPGNFDVMGHNFRGNYDWSGKLRLQILPAAKRRGVLFSQ